MNSFSPIGIFDSGVGGTSIWMEIHQLLPNENTIYLADSMNAPYGYKSVDEVIALSIKNTDILLDLGCKIIVVACNTATTQAISELRSKYDVQVIGIEPAIKPAALQTQTKSIGILATKGTLSSSLFYKTSELISKDISVIEVVGEGLVPLIEEGKLDSPEMMDLLFKYTKPMIDANVDRIVLGCSHYPHIIAQLQKLLPSHVKIIDSGIAVAKQTKLVLERNHLLNTNFSDKSSLKFYSNKKTDTLKLLLGDYTDQISIELKDF